MSKGVIVMLSGGVDSTYLLWYYLTQTDYEVHAHHISLRTSSEPRWEQEGYAVAQIFEYCRANYRPFKSSESVYSLQGFDYLGWDSDVILLMAARVAANQRKPCEVAMGWTMDDTELRIVRERRERGVYKNLWFGLRNSLDLRRQALVPEDVTFTLEELGKYKKDIIAELPPALLQMSWSCRTPRKGKPCGQCKPCRAIKEIVDA